MARTPGSAASVGASGMTVERMGMLTVALIALLMMFMMSSRLGGGGIAAAPGPVVVAAPVDARVEALLAEAERRDAHQQQHPPPPHGGADRPLTAKDVRKASRPPPVASRIKPAAPATVEAVPSDTESPAGEDPAPPRHDAVVDGGEQPKRRQRVLSEPSEADGSDFDEYPVIRDTVEAPRGALKKPAEYVMLPSAGTTRKLFVPRSKAAEHHIAASAAGALYTGPLKLAHTWKNPNLDEVTGPNIRTLPANGSWVCEFMLFGMPHVCKIETGEESMLDCIDRIGGRVLEKALPTRCTKTQYWQSVRDRGPAPADASADTGRDWVYMAQTTPTTEKPSYIPPAERTYRRDIPSRHCSYGTLHPITFAVPYRNIVPFVTRHKFFDFLPYGMRKFPPWIFRPGDYRMGHQDEFLTSLLHKHSYFAFTHKRGGWDCMRHTEIFAAGTIPYFADIHMCGKYCLALLPKDLLKEALELPGVSYIGGMQAKRAPNQEFIEPIARGTANMNFKKPGRIDWKAFDEDKYWTLAERIHNYTRNYLSTRSLVAYVLHKIKYEEPRHAFVLGRDHMDFLELQMESGFADLGINYTTHYTRPTWHRVVEPGENEHFTAAEFEAIRNKRGLKSEMHGASMVLGLRIPPLQNPVDHELIRQKLKNKEFDLVVYTWPHFPVGGYPFWKEVSESVPRDRIVFIDGGDDGNDPHDAYRKAIKHGHIFRRELHDGNC
uniref:Uncharacterized protein n=1 Tax=Neobodo designis TaxID=312471 RepID=A0A7S1M9D5_NEODS